MMGVDMERATYVVWATLGIVGCALVVVAVLVGITTEFVMAKAGSRDD